MKVNIKRERWVVIRDNKEIFCGLAKHYQFKKLDEIGDTAIKTYLSEAKARASFISSWWMGEEQIADGRIEFVKVVESINSEEQTK